MAIKFIQKTDWNLIIALLLFLAIVGILVGFFKLTAGFWTGPLGLNPSMLPFID